MKATTTKWTVRVIVGNMYEIEVDAETYQQASDIAEGIADTEGTFTEVGRMVTDVYEVDLKS